MKKLSNTEAELKKSIAYKKKGVLLCINKICRYSTIIKRRYQRQ